MSFSIKIAFFCGLFFCAPSGILLAQKKVINSSCLEKKWPSLNSAVISNNGEFASYSISDFPISGVNTLFVQNIKNGLKQMYRNADGFHFSADSRYGFFVINDTLKLLSLDNERIEKSVVIKSYRSPSGGSVDWMAYQPKSQNEALVLLDFSSGKSQQFNNVLDYKWESEGKVLLLALKQDSRTALVWIDLPGIINKQIWSSSDSIPNNSLYEAASFDAKAEQLSLISIKKTNGSICHNIWYYRKGYTTALKIADDHSAGIDSGLSVSGRAEFSLNGRWLFFHLQKHVFQSKHYLPGAAKVDIYSYRDAVLQSQQLRNLNRSYSYLAAIPVSGGKVRQLQHEMEGQSFIVTQPNATPGDFIVLGEMLNKDFKPWWMAAANPFTYYLVSLKDEKKTLLKKSAISPSYEFSFSPDRNWLVYWDSSFAGYMGYNLHNGKTTNLTHTIPDVARRGDYINMFSESLHKQPIDRIKWLKFGSHFLLYSLYDIWKVDASNKQSPICITHNYGLKHHILLRLVNEDLSYKGNEQVLLVGFDNINNQNGFFKANLGNSETPIPLVMGAYCYFQADSQLPFPRSSFSPQSAMAPVQATGANAWIVLRQTANEYPNYYYTRDWKEYKPLTNLHPQQEYNWLTSELIQYKQTDGTLSQGVLYKPENFDSKKKYPIIFNYYEHLSYRLYEFPNLDYSTGNMNIPWFVSQGYLVFIPDIHYDIANSKKGKTVGEAALNSVEGAARYFAKLQYVDSKHMGIQGHSFGGGETNYLVTHSRIFAAACSAAGTVSDQISAYLGPFRSNGNEPNFYRVRHSENGHEMIGATLWQRPDLYFRSSAVFNADKVTTPLLLMHNENDEQTDWGQSFEMYTALMRLGKPVWLLQYDNEGHVLSKGDDKKDFTIRLTEFFDHYLKNAAIAKWMAEGIPAKSKGIEQGYESDSRSLPSGQ